MYPRIWAFDVIRLLAGVGLIGGILPRGLVPIAVIPIPYYSLFLFLLQKKKKNIYIFVQSDAQVEQCYTR